MPLPTQRNGTAGEGDSLILTPSKLRLHSCVFGPYITTLWLPNAILAALLLFKLGYGIPLQWWLVFLPQWIGHAGHVLLVAIVLASVDKLVLQQLGPAPPASASPGMVLQYNAMFSERRQSLIIDNICSLIENVAGVIVKVIMCRALTTGVISSPSFCWRVLLLPCWVAWGLTFAVSLYKPKKERTFGSMRDLLYICLLFVALKLDGLAAYTWSVVFLIPWMWFGALFLGAIVTAGVIIVAYACMDLRELALPGGFLLLLLSASAQLPFFIFLCNYLDGDTAVTMQEILLPQVASWAAMWMSGLIICWGLHKKEQLRARLAAAGQVWTAHENAARELMSLELEDMQHQVDKMSNEELAQVAMRMMEGKAQPQQLLRVGSTLYRRAMSFTMTSPRPMSVIKQLDGDGTAQLTELTGPEAMEQGRAWTISPHTGARIARESCEGAVCVNVQLVLPPAAKVMGSKAAADDASQPSSSKAAGSTPGQVGDVCIAVDDGECSTAAAAPDAEATAATTATVSGTLLAPAAAAAAAAAAGSASSQSQQASAAQPPAAAAAAVAAVAALISPGAAARAAARAMSPGDADDGLCTICYDEQATCVLMECGHGGYCWRCAHVLFARPPSECPVCRQPIMQVLELEDPSCKVGRPVKVKPLSRTVSRSGSGSWFK